MDEPTEEDKRLMAERAAAIEARYAAKQADQPAPSPAAPPPMRVMDEGGEASMNVSDSNALRASLGLKPLQDSASKDDVARAEHRRHVDRQRGREQKKEAKALEVKLAEKREQRRIEGQLKKTRGLGERAQPEDDDVLVRICTLVSGLGEASP
jgi:hypothetical protein